MQTGHEQSGEQPSAGPVVMQLPPVGERERRPQETASRATYRMRAERVSGGRLRLTVADGDDATQVACWEGRVAQSVLAAALPATYCATGEWQCDKACLMRLMLAAAAAESALEKLDAKLAGLVPAPEAGGLRSIPGQHEDSDESDVAARRKALTALANRLRDTGQMPSPGARAIAGLLFRHPGQHFSAEDVQCLVAFEYPLSPDLCARQHLDELAAQRIVQRIDVAPDIAFYDIDTTPHAHRYDPETGELFDV